MSETPRCNCATFGNAHSCPVHTQEDYELSSRATGNPIHTLEFKRVHETDIVPGVFLDGQFLKGVKQAGVIFEANSLTQVHLVFNAHVEITDELKALLTVDQELPTPPGGPDAG